MEQLCLNLTRAFQEEAFLQKLARPREEAEALLSGLDWPALLPPLAPIEERISCEKALEAFRPVLDGRGHRLHRPRGSEQLHHRRRLLPYLFTSWCPA